MKYRPRKHLPHEIPSWVDPHREIYFITVNCQQRFRNQLARPLIAEQLFETVQHRQGKFLWWPYLFLLMPDQLHGLLSFPPSDKPIRGIISQWKKWTNNDIGIVWQDDCFEHRLRHGESRRQRVLDLGLAGLQEAPRPGRPKSLPAHKVQTVLTEVVRPPKGQARWSCRRMARHSGLSHSAVQRLWAANALQPHRTRTFKLSTAPQFETQFWDIVGLYLAPPTRALVLCCDKKSQCQAVERTQPGLPLGPGHSATRTHDYYRPGTVTLFAALNHRNGKILAERAV